MAHQKESSVWGAGLVAAFAAIYVIWGSTYFAIRVGIETFPPFLMAGVRFLAAGAPLYLLLRLRGAARPQLSDWGGALVLGTLMLAGGNGLVTWAEQRVPSGIAAVIIATVPLWMTLFEAWPLGRRRITPRVLGGLLCGLAGVAVLVAPGGVELQAIDLVGTAVLLVAALSWSTGSLLSRSLTLPRAPLMVAAMQMVAGGVVLLSLGTLAGEWGGFEPAAVSLRSVLALVYLITFGSVVALGCYVWLLRVTSAAAVSTYAFVNPVVAVGLGWAFAGEELGARTLLGAALVVGAVAFLQGAQMLSRLRLSVRPLAHGDRIRISEG